MTNLTEAMAKVMLHNVDPPMSWNQAQQLAEKISALFTIHESREPEYDESLMRRYKGLKIVRRWVYTDG